MLFCSCRAALSRPQSRDPANFRCSSLSGADASNASIPMIRLRGSVSPLDFRAATRSMYRCASSEERSAPPWKPCSPRPSGAPPFPPSGFVQSAEIRRQRHAAVDALIGIAPRDEFEGMIAAQLIAAHNAAMECYRRAMIGEQTFEGRRENLSQANKLSRTYATLLEALNRHRGKGQQKVTVEHVHVHAGGQAVVGMVETPGAGITAKSEDQPHAKQIAYAPQPAMWSADPEREAVPVTSDAERPLPDARGTVTGGSEGE